MRPARRRDDEVRRRQCPIRVRRQRGAYNGRDKLDAPAAHVPRRSGKELDDASTEGASAPSRKISRLRDVQVRAASCRTLRREHPLGCSSGFGRSGPRQQYKTNARYELGTRVVLSYMVSPAWVGGGFRVDHDREQRPGLRQARSARLDGQGLRVSRRCRRDRGEQERRGRDGILRVPGVARTGTSTSVQAPRLAQAPGRDRGAGSDCEVRREGLSSVPCGARTRRATWRSLRGPHPDAEWCGSASPASRPAWFTSTAGRGISARRARQ